MSKLCLNMIVKNEAAIIDRCLASVADVIDCYVIGDTGSTDGTQDKIRAFFDQRGIPGKIVEFPFIDFAQARNAAIEAAEESELDYDYLLFTDADMELVVEDSAAFEGLSDTGYMVVQRTGSGLNYDNARLSKKGNGARYKGVTHEYIALGDHPKRLEGIHYIDHACGSNRGEKVDRDIRLLEQGMKDEPENGRYHFYLAQTFYESGRFVEARDLYAKRIEIGGFEEECWYSAMMGALCERNLGNDAEFQSEILSAWQRRPTRAEPLYHLAAYYLKKGWNDLACLICEEGLRIEIPEDDILFKEGAIYARGFKEIFSIAGYYSKGRRTRSFQFLNWLSLARAAGEGSSHLATTNTPHFLVRLAVFCESWQATKIEFPIDDGWHPLNPSVARIGDGLAMIVRTVNYKVHFHDQGASYVTPEGAPITTRNFLLNLSDDLSVTNAKEILLPIDMPEPSYKDILGVEDLRLCAFGDEAFVNGTCCEIEPSGHRHMISARLNPESGQLDEMRVIVPDDVPRQMEKNWAPFVIDGALRYLYSYEPTRVVNGDGSTYKVSESPILAKSFRGGSQLIPFEDGWLCIVHQVSFQPRVHKRTYFHRFVWFDRDLTIRKVSLPFVLNHVRYEFVAGLAWAADGERLVISYGVDDCEAWVATVSATDVSEFLQSVDDFN